MLVYTSTPSLLEARDPVIAQEQPQPGMEGAVYLADAWRFTQRNTLSVLVGAALAVLVAIAVVWTSPTVYRSSSLLAVVSERPGADFVPPLLSSEGYLKLLKARPVTVETFRRAQASVPGISGDHVRLTPKLMSSRRGELGNASLLELLAEGPTPEAATALANAWAEVCLDLDLRQSRLAAMRNSYIRLQAEEQKTLDKAHTARFRLEAIQTRLAATPSTLSLTSRLSDRELLASTGQSGSTVVSQEVNPFHVQLLGEAATTETELSALERLAKSSKSAREKLKAQLDILSSVAAGAEASPLVTEIEPIEGVPLPEYGSVQLVSLALPASRPEPSHGLAKVMLAALGGAILGLLVAALREAVRILPPAMKRT